MRKRWRQTENKKRDGDRQKMRKQLEAEISYGKKWRQTENANKDGGNQKFSIRWRQEENKDIDGDRQTQ